VASVYKGKAFQGTRSPDARSIPSLVMLVVPEPSLAICGIPLSSHSSNLARFSAHVHAANALNPALPRQTVASCRPTLAQMPIIVVDYAPIGLGYQLYYPMQRGGPAQRIGRPVAVSTTKLKRSVFFTNGPDPNGRRNKCSLYPVVSTVLAQPL
jgi:hypothetical protein